MQYFTMSCQYPSRKVFERSIPASNADKVNGMGDYRQLQNSLFLTYDLLLLYYELLCLFLFFQNQHQCPVDLKILIYFNFQNMRSSTDAINYCTQSCICKETRGMFLLLRTLLKPTAQLFKCIVLTFTVIFMTLYILQRNNP